jgi:protein SCO1/2
MEPSTERLSRTIWIGVALVILLLGGAFVLSRMQPRQQPLPVLGQIADFALTNQLGQATTLQTLRGRVWLADIIFTRCPGPCARMTRQMASVQDALPKDSGAQFVSLTTDPEFDSPEILSKYAARFGADSNRWHFLTGTKKEIGALAAQSLKLAAVEKAAELRENPDDLFIHATIFVLVDKQARLRGIFETGGDGIEWATVQASILSAIKQLERER